MDGELWVVEQHQGERWCFLRSWVDEGFARTNFREMQAKTSCELRLVPYIRREPPR